MSSRERLIKYSVIEKRFLKCRSRKEIRKEGGREGGKKRREKETQKGGSRMVGVSGEEETRAEQERTQVGAGWRKIPTDRSCPFVESDKAPHLVYVESIP